MNLNYDMNVRNNSNNKAMAKTMNNDLSDMEVSENNSLAMHYATTRISNLRDSLQDVATAANSESKNNQLRKSIAGNSHQDMKGSTAGQS